MKPIVGFQILFLLFSIDAFAAKRPLNCLISSGGVIQRKSCRNYNASSTKNFPKVCIFEAALGGWHRGRMEWNDKKSSFDFIPKEACSHGIEVVDIDDAMRFQAPRKFSPKVTRAGGVFTSTYDRAEVNITGDERPVYCSFHPKGGVRTKGASCSQFPNAAGYCKLKRIKTGNFQGLWWVRYSRKNQVKPRVCVGGVRKVNLRTVATSTGEKERLISNPRVAEASYVSEVTATLNPGDTREMDFDAGKADNAAACMWRNPATGKMIRNACSRNRVFPVKVANYANDDYNVRQGRCYATRRNNAANPYEVHFVTKNSRHMQNAINQNKTRRCEKIEDIQVEFVEPVDLDEEDV